jgi:hypothetical protein
LAQAHVLASSGDGEAGRLSFDLVGFGFLHDGVDGLDDFVAYEHHVYTMGSGDDGMLTYLQSFNVIS